MVCISLLRRNAIKLITRRFTLTGNSGQHFSIGFLAFNAFYRKVCIGFPASELFVILIMEYKEYPRLIIFEMHVLPEYAFALDMLSDANTFTGISEKCSEWFWRFSICVGMPKLSASTDVINNSIEALKVLQNPSDKIVNKIKQVFPNFGRCPQLVDSFSGLC